MEGRNSINIHQLLGEKNLSLSEEIKKDLESRITEDAIDRERVELTKKQKELEQLAEDEPENAKKAKLPLNEIKRKLSELKGVSLRISGAMNEMKEQKSQLSLGDLKNLRHLLSKTSLYAIDSGFIKAQVAQINANRDAIIDRIAVIGHLTPDQKDKIKQSPHSTNDLEFICIRIEKDPELIKSNINITSNINEQIENLETEREDLISSILKKVKKDDQENVRILLQEMTMSHLSQLDQTLLPTKEYSQSRREIIKKRTIYHFRSEVGSKLKFDPSIFLSKQFHIKEEKEKMSMAHASKLISGHIELQSVKEIKEKYQFLIDNYGKLHKGDQEAMRALLVKFGSSDNCMKFIKDLLDANIAYQDLCIDYKTNIDLYKRQGVKPPATILGDPYTGIKPHSEGGISPPEVSPELLSLSDYNMLTTLSDQMRNLDQNFRKGVAVITADKYPIAEWKETLKYTRKSETTAIEQSLVSIFPAAAKAKTSQETFNAAFISDRTLKEKEIQEHRDKIQKVFSKAVDIAAAAAFGSVGTMVTGVVKQALEEVEKQVPGIRDSIGALIASKIIKDPFNEAEGAAKPLTKADIIKHFTDAREEIQKIFEQKFTKENIEATMQKVTKEILAANKNKVFSTIELHDAVEEKMLQTIEQWKTDYDKALTTFTHHIKTLAESQKAQMITRDVASIAKKMTNIEMFKGKLEDINDFCDNFPELWSKAKGRWGNDILIGAIENSTWLGGDENAELRESLGFIKKTQIKKTIDKDLIDSAIKKGIEKVEELTQEVGIKQETYIQRQRLLTAFAATIVVFSLNKHCRSALTFVSVSPREKAAALLDIFIAAARLPEFGSRSQSENNLIFRLMKTMPDVNNMLNDVNIMRELIKLRSSPDTKLSLKSDEVGYLDTLMWNQASKILIVPMIAQAKQAIQDARDNMEKLAEKEKAAKESVIIRSDEEIVAITKMLNVIAEIQQLPRHYQLENKNDFENALRSCHDAIPKINDVRATKMLSIAVTEQNKKTVAKVEPNADAAMKARVIVQCLLLASALQHHQNSSDLTLKQPLLEQIRQTPEIAKWLKEPGVLEQIRMQDGYSQLQQSLHHAFLNIVNVKQHLDKTVGQRINELVSKAKHQLSEEKRPDIQDKVNLELLANIAMLHHLNGLDNKNILPAIVRDENISSVPGMQRLFEDPKIKSKLRMCMMQMDMPDFQQFSKQLFVSEEKAPVLEKSQSPEIYKAQKSDTKASREAQIAVREDVVVLVNISTHLDNYLKHNNRNPLFKGAIELLNERVKEFKKILNNKSTPSPLSESDYKLLKLAVAAAREQIAKESGTMKFKLNNIKLFGKSGNELKKMIHVFDSVDKMIDFELARKQQVVSSPLKIKIN